MSALQRIRQGLAGLRPRPDAEEPALIARWLTPAQQRAFLALPVHDRRHLAGVGKALAGSGANPDLVVAGFLHDIGKVDGKHRVRLLDRVAKVLLERTAPRLLARLANPASARPRFPGLVLAVYHPEIGARKARDLGCTERTIWLIKNHENRALADPDLRRLIEIDQSTP